MVNWPHDFEMHRGRRHKLRLSLLCLVCSLTTVYMINHSGNTPAHTFALEKNPRLGVSWLGQAWTAKNDMECVRNCLRKYDNCKSVLYNPDTDLCRPGSQFKKTAPLPNSDEGNFYHSLYCDGTSGFRQLSNGSTKSCIGKFGPAMTYIEADIACQNRGGFLASVKTMNKLEIVRQISKFKQIWVGCDDIEEEGIFVWKEDGETFSASSPPSTFAQGQPNNDNGIGGEHCVVIDPSSYALNYLNDINCSSTRHYACEKIYI